MTKLNAFCQTCGDTPCPDCFPGETFNRTYQEYSDMLRRMARDRTRRKRQLRKALCAGPRVSWEGLIRDARSAGIVRDAEYRRADRVERENARLRCYLRGMARRVAYWRGEAIEARRDFETQRHCAHLNFECVTELEAELDQTRNELAEATHKRDSRVESLACALYLIAEYGCRYFPERTSCRDMRGKARAWCAACVAIDALGHDPSGRS